MTDHTEAWQYSASSVVASALAEAFPLLGKRSGDALRMQMDALKAGLVQGLVANCGLRWARLRRIFSSS